MVTNSHYALAAGHTLTVTVIDGTAHVQQIESASIAALVTNAAPQVFGPYALSRTFRVQERPGVTVAIAESDLTANIPSTAQAAMLDAIPTADQDDSATVWNDAGALKVSTAP
jgi:hypothetical protein